MKYPKNITEAFEILKLTSEMPVCVAQYSYMKNDALHPFEGVDLNLRNRKESLQKMYEKSKSIDGFMFFNHSLEGLRFWSKGLNRQFRLISSKGKKIHYKD